MIFKLLFNVDVLILITSLLNSKVENSPKYRGVVWGGRAYVLISPHLLFQALRFSPAHILLQAFQ